MQTRHPGATSLPLRQPVKLNNPLPNYYESFHVLLYDVDSCMMYIIIRDHVGKLDSPLMPSTNLLFDITKRYVHILSVA